MIKNKIVLVPFPFDDFSQSKVRPAVCLTNPVGQHNHIVIAFISSKIPTEKIATDIPILKSEPNFNSSGLLVNSVIKIHKLITIPEKLISRELGFADDKLSKQINNCVKLLFEL